MENVMAVKKKKKPVKKKSSGGKGLAGKAKSSGIALGTLKKVYKRGQGGHLSPHKAYPQFFGTPKSAPRSIDTREKASGGNMARLSRLSNNNRLASLNSSMGEDGSITYIYAVQPVIT